MLSGRNHRDRLRELEERKVFLIVGKADQGKSSLPADFLERNKLQNTWFNLVEEEQDPKILREWLKSCFYPHFPENDSAQASS